MERGCELRLHVARVGLALGGPDLRVPAGALAPAGIPYQRSKMTVAPRFLGDHGLRLKRCARVDSNHHGP